MPPINDNLQAAAMSIAFKLIDQGHEAFFVGGGIRDMLFNVRAKDIDIATSANPGQIISIFPDANLVGKNFGVIVVRSEGYQFEIATFRRDGNYVDFRKPESVEFGSMEDDVQRRDFTINALYSHPVSGNIIDLVGGLEDFDNKLLRCVGKADDRFAEDSLRLLRAVRFASRFEFTIETKTFEAIVRHARNIKHIAPERIREELERMLIGPHPALALDLLRDTGLLIHILPEVHEMIGVEQDPEYHWKEFEISEKNDVFTHTKLVLENLEPRINTHAWACLLHDIGKPSTSTVGEDGKIHSLDHAKVGADIARNILTRLRFSNDELELICKTIYDHMKPMSIKEMKKSTLRRFLGSEHAGSIFALHRADCLASNNDLSNLEFAKEVLETFVSEQILPKPLITGHHLLELGVKQGPIFGKILKEVQTKQLEEEISTEAEALKLAGVLSEKYVGILSEEQKGAKNE